MPSPLSTRTSPVSSYLPNNNDEYRHAMAKMSGGNPMGILDFLGAMTNQPSKFLGDKTFDATGSPALSTAAYMLPQLAGLPREAFANVAGGALRMGAKALHEGMMGSGPMARPLASIAPMNIIKPKGGNWDESTVDNFLKPLYKRDGTLYGADINSLQPHPTSAAHMVDPSTGAVFNSAQVNNSKIIKQSNDWVNGPLKKYIMRDMGTEGDPIRRLAESNILHVDPEQLNYNPNFHGMYDRADKVPAGTTIAAKTWDGLADKSITSGPHPDFPGSIKHYIAATYPSHFCFDHLMDTLRGGLSDGSIDPRSLANGNFSVDAAVRNAHNINEKAAKALQDAKNATSSALPVHREYPDGYKWIELKADPSKVDAAEAGYKINPIMDNFKKVDPTGHLTTKDANSINIHDFGIRQDYQKAFDDSGEHSMHYSNNFWPWLKENQPEKYNDLINQEDYSKPSGWHEILNKAGEEIDQTKPGQDPLQIAQNHASNDVTKQALKDEGDNMGHCVGSYSQDVNDGTSRIFSLRDKNNNPHTTIEIGRGTVKSLPAEVEKEIGDKAYQNALKEGHEPDTANFNDFYNDKYQTLAENHINSQPPSSVIQIKGKSNGAPIDQYKSYVQDFLRNPFIDLNTKEGSIGDLKNSGLTQLPEDHPLAQKLGSQFATQEEINNYDAPVQNKANGGAINRILMNNAPRIN